MHYGGVDTGNSAGHAQRNAINIYINMYVYVKSTYSMYYINAEFHIYI